MKPEIPIIGARVDTPLLSWELFRREIVKIEKHRQEMAARQRVAELRRSCIVRGASRG